MLTGKHKGPQWTMLGREGGVWETVNLNSLRRKATTANSCIVRVERGCSPPGPSARTLFVYTVVYTVRGVVLRFAALTDSS